MTHPGARLVNWFPKTAVGRWLYGEGYYIPRVGVLSKDQIDTIGVSTTFVPITDYDYGRSTKLVTIDPVTGRITFDLPGLYSINAQVVYDLGNQDVDVEIRLYEVISGDDTFHTIARYGKGGYGDNIVLVGAGEIETANPVFELQIACSISLTMTIYEVDFVMHKLSNSIHIDYRHP